MRMKKIRAALALCACLALSGAALPAQAAAYSDLDWSHWAYYDMTEAAGYGILQGTGADTMSPAAPLTWSQFLAMAARAFAPEVYNFNAASGVPWDQAGLLSARSAGLLEGLDESALTGDVTRQDAAVVLYNALPEEYTPSFWDAPIDPTTLSDWGSMDELHQQAVAELARRCIIQGRADGSFGCADTLQRCDGAVLLMRVLEQVDQARSGERVTITLRCINANTGMAVVPVQQVEATVGQSAYSLLDGVDVGYFKREYRDTEPGQISTACSVYDYWYVPMTEAEIEEAQFWEKVDRGEASAEDYYKQDFWLRFQGENQRKSLLLFGDETKFRFTGREEAEAAMTTVTVPVWQLSNGQKVSSTLSFPVHAAIAGDVQEIFTEIYNDPEQFPIRDLGGYSWRGDNATGEHNCGTAIDINANENYQIRDGQIEAGSCWEPGTNPYSIAPDSSVVRIFAEHGWSWGGDAWAYSSDDAEGYHDYMHFSYLGE